MQPAARRMPAVGQPVAQRMPAANQPVARWTPAATRLRSAGCFGKKHCGGLLSGLLKRHRCKMRLRRGLLRTGLRCGGCLLRTGLWCSGCLLRTELWRDGRLLRRGCVPRLLWQEALWRTAVGSVQAASLRDRLRRGLLRTGLRCGECLLRTGLWCSGCLLRTELWRDGRLLRQRLRFRRLLQWSQVVQRRSAETSDEQAPHGLCCDSGCDAGCCEPACGSPDDVRPLLWHAANGCASCTRLPMLRQLPP